MIVIEAGRPSERAFDAKLLFAAQLAERGHRVGLDDALLPEKFDRVLRYEAAPFLAALDDTPPDRVILLGAEDIAPEVLARLRAVAGTAEVAALGTFADHQSEVGARTRLAYALGREARVIDLGKLHESLVPVAGISPLAAPERVQAVPQEVPELVLFLPAELLEEPHVLPLLAALDHVPTFRLSIVTPSAGKDRLRRSRYAGLNVFGYSELAPAGLARRADLVAFYGEGIPGERMAACAIDALAAGKPVIDATTGAAFVAARMPVLRGPEELAALPQFLDHAVLPNLTVLGRAAREDPWMTRRSIVRLEAALGLAPVRAAAQAPIPIPAPGPDPAPPRIVFLPTNGNGLGHAQRCALVAEALPDPGRAAFAAFPSCVPLLTGRGFPCLPLVQKSDDHPDEFANDIVNYLRLLRLLGPGDHLVFDGGYVFESIYRALHETGCTGTWIRRGLLRPGQAAEAQAERERAFRSVVVPGEAFDELNVDYSRGPLVHRVGPVVQPAPAMTPAEVRSRLAAAFGTPFETLVVTMLGGGVASDRSAQLQSVAAGIERRDETLNLVVLWPGARVSPGLYGWRRTRVVQTRDSLRLAQAADLAISAAGYNSFHELLYHRVPTIFLPQSAPFLDDQERRARAAAERGLAEIVLAHEMLLLERRLHALLDGGTDGLRAALGAINLPETGNAAAARKIAEAAA